MVDFIGGVNHNHQPCGRWSEIQANPNSPGAPFGLETLCKTFSPSSLVWFAKKRIWDNPLGKRHIDWYLQGTGMDYIENDALKIVLLNNKGVRSAIARRLPAGQTTGQYTSFFKLEQKHYGLDDARTAWGAIDRFEFEVDYDAKTIHVWFKDRYEWHPYYPSLYPVCEGDAPARETNCLHAAFVEMKNEGAADFWMVGEATVSLDGIPGSGSSASNAPDW